jgi:hypothetical protein
MKTRTLALVILTLVLAPMAAFAGPASLHHGGGSSSTSLSGVYSVTFNLTVASTLPAGSTIVCKAQVSPNVQQGYFGVTNQAVPVESAFGTATVSGSTATCAVEIPFSWTLSSSSSSATLAYEIDAYNANGTLPSVVRVSSQSGLSETLPASGATETVTLNLTF